MTKSNRLNALGSTGSHVLAAVGCWMDEHPHGTLGLLLVFFLATVLPEAHARPLLNDEIYTARIATAPTLRTMWQLAREIDLHPPLHYLIQRYVLLLPGPVWLVARLPSIVCAGLATALLFQYTQRRLGSVLAVISAAVLWTGPAQAFFWSNRPYMLYIALLLLLQVAYLRATHRGRSVWPLLGVFALSALMISDELIGIAALFGFALAEWLRWKRNHQADWWLWMALFTPSVLGLGLVYQVRHMGQNAFPASRMPSLGQLATTYGDQVTQLFFLLSVVAVTSVYLQPGRRAAVKKDLSARSRTLDPVEGAFSVGLLLVPTLLMIASAVLHVQYWERYAMCAVVGFAELVPWLLYRRLPRLRVLGPLLVLLFVATTAVQAAQDAFPDKGGPDRIAVSALDRDLPIVDANPMTFTEMSDREEPGVAARIYYITDREEAARISQYTLFENEDKIVRLLRLPSHAESRQQFFAEHPRFWLVADPANSTEWILRSLVQHGATVAWKGKIKPGYDDADLYLVEVH